jgi:S1-C subfamily serine protease
MNGIVIRLAGVEQPETRVLHQEMISIGTAATCDLSFRPDDYALPASAELLTLSANGGGYRIMSIAEAGSVVRDGEPVVVGEAIRDGDTLYFGATGIRLRFFYLSPSMELAETLKIGTAVLGRVRAAEQAVATNGGQRVAAPRTDIALVFVKQLLRELVAEIPRRVLYVVLGLAVFIIGSIVYINTLSFLDGRRNRDAISKLKERLDEVQVGVKEAQKAITETKEQSESLTSMLSSATRVIDTYGPGVCLIYGTYSFVDPRSGREARYKEPTELNNPISPTGNLNLSVDGNGPVYEMEVIGTGFLVDKGMVLTNRHVAEPWYDDPVSSIIRNQGFQARLKELDAYFPKQRQPFKLRMLETGRRMDVALCTFEQGDAPLPILPLDEKSDAVSGQSVVLLGYPAGIDGLLAKADDVDGQAPLQTVLNELAGRQLIRPYSTQGNIGDITAARIVYDAQTSEGGSGGPVFGSNGKVIGINQAMLPGSPANFGVPIRFGIELIRKHKPTAEVGLGQAAANPTPANSNQPK